MEKQANRRPADSLPASISPQVRLARSSRIREEHGDDVLGRGESACIWRHSALEGLELFRGSYRKHRFARHFHTVAAIGVVERGAMRYYCRRVHHLLPVGTVLLLNPGEVHAPSPAGTAGWTFRVFYFDDGLFQHCSEQAGGLLRFGHTFVQNARLAENVIRLHRRLESSGCTLEIESALLTMMTKVAGRYCRPPDSAPVIEAARVRKMLDYLHGSYSQSITLADVAAVADASPFHALRIFSGSVGLPPHAYLTQIRVEAAKKLLRRRASIAEVADQTGFIDQSHLTRHFKRITGVTPGNFLLSLEPVGQTPPRD